MNFDQKMKQKERLRLLEGMRQKQLNSRNIYFSSGQTSGSIQPPYKKPRRK